MPASNLTYRRGEIRWVKLDPVVGAEAQKTRPSLIVQNDIINQYGLLTIVMPFRPGSILQTVKSLTPLQTSPRERGEA